ncbi:electron transfer flavoprotein alpha subunit apoprotein [Ruminiclostridium sufflavum DSM 19573]|uniref:Electron transfer flavoprotein alpha subunit apoprotein n=1 Tax=Ruminiclostridium sufflavum DSM 19573 TaxID=1121337 RepID=A0A318XI57_9FIRM|nr:electron transfer flavoprotein subunit alpha/FixB family protein [Ruminiclostridium sufflavum]PYG84945.1 electron transfer flavoprotein alpha subunit apoprotein [Ruminiclostridium sufflavum DSM 19573]
MNTKEELKQIVVIGDLHGDIEFDQQVTSIAASIGRDWNKQVLFIQLIDMSDGALEFYFDYGVDKIVKIDHNQFNMRQMNDILLEEIKALSPSLVLTGSNKQNCEIAANIATALEIGLVAECIAIKMDNGDKKLKFSRAAISSSVIADIICDECDIQMSTVKKDCFISQYMPCDHQKKSIIHKVIIGHNDNEMNYKLINKVAIEAANESVKLNSKVIIGVGRGAIKFMPRIEKLAEVLQTEIGVTRPLVDEGLMPHSQQIGQSGKSIKPDLYIALGVSGASQHVVGMLNAKKVIAVNIDEEAPIKKHCDYFIHLNVEEFINNILKECEK